MTGLKNWGSRLAKAGTVAAALSGLSGYNPSSSDLPAPHAYSYNAYGLQGDKQQQDINAKQLAAMQRGEKINFNKEAGEATKINSIIKIVDDTFKSKLGIQTPQVDILQSQSASQGTLCIVDVRGTVYADSPEQAKEMVVRQINAMKADEGMEMNVQFLGNPDITVQDLGTPQTHEATIHQSYSIRIRAKILIRGR